jgi:hypothetical protein
VKLLYVEQTQPDARDISGTQISSAVFFLRQSHWLIGIFVLDTENCLFPKNTEEWGKKQIKEA